MPNFIEPLAKRRKDEMKELRAKAAAGNQAAQRELRRRCRTGMVVPAWER